MDKHIHLYKKRTNTSISFLVQRNIAPPYAQITNKTSTHITSKRIDRLLGACSFSFSLSLQLLFRTSYPLAPLLSMHLLPSRRLLGAAARVLHPGQGTAHTPDAGVVRADARRPVVVVRLELLRAPRTHVGAAASLYCEKGKGRVGG